ncbi:MAG: NADH-quinone oxidoreductase subunit C [Bacteroidota bacterium]
MNDRILSKLVANFRDSILSSNEFRGELTIVVKPENIVPICQFLRDDPELQFDLLIDVHGIDMLRSELDRSSEIYSHDDDLDLLLRPGQTEQPAERFQVVYNIWSLKNKARLRLKVLLPESNLHVPSVTTVWPGANWPERETFDMFGIIFDGHPDLRRIYMPEEFEYYPLRKDFPLMGIPGSLRLPKGESSEEKSQK